MSTLSNGVIQQNMSCTETFSATELPAAGSPAIEHNQFNRTLPTLTASTSPKLSAAVIMEVTLVAGAFTLDLTAAPDRRGGTQDLTGYKLTSIQINNKEPTNGNFTIGAAASNPFEPFGVAGNIVEPGGSISKYCHLTGPTVGAGAKNLKFAGTGTQKCQLVMWFAAP